MIKEKCPYWVNCELYNANNVKCDKDGRFYDLRYRGCELEKQKTIQSKIAIIIGTRAEYIKTFPIMLELQKQDKYYYFIHTGQHKLGDLCEIFGTKKPDVILSVEPDESSKFNAKESKAIKWACGMIFKIRKELKKLPNLKFIIVHGDTMSTGVAAISSSMLLNLFKKYRNVHLESGLRSNNNREPFPEEIIRKIVTKFSDILIAPSELSRVNLTKGKYRGKTIIKLGNTILDSVDCAFKMAQEKKIEPFNKNKFVLVTIHRHENIKDPIRLTKIVEILKSITIPVYFSLHDNTRAKLKEFGLFKKLENNKNIHFGKNMDYVSFIYQMSKCSLIVCDGGSMQEESLIFQKPCIILRMNTERQEGLQTNFQFLSKLDVVETKKKIQEYLSPKFKVEKFKNPYEEKDISKKIVEILK